MCRDNTVLIVRLEVRKRCVWVVIHVQAHEIFGDPHWTRWWLYSHPSQAKYTTKRPLAIRIARNMATGIQSLEHGIIMFFSKAQIDDCILKKGNMYFKGQSVEEPDKWYDESEEDDWKNIDGSYF